MARTRAHVAREEVVQAARQVIGFADSFRYTSASAYQAFGKLAVAVSELAKAERDAAVYLTRSAPVTSRMAADRAQVGRYTLRQQVYETIEEAGPNGISDLGIEHVIDRAHQSVSSARYSLAQAGLIYALPLVPGEHSLRWVISR